MILQKIVDSIVSMQEKEEKQRKIFDGIHDFRILIIRGSSLAQWQFFRQIIRHLHEFQNSHY